MPVSIPRWMVSLKGLERVASMVFIIPLVAAIVEPIIVDPMLVWPMLDFFPFVAIGVV